MNSLYALLKNYLPGWAASEIGAEVEEELTRAVSGRAAKTVGRAFTKPLDRLLEQGAKKGLPPENVRAAAQQLADQQADALALVMLELRGYPKVAANVETLRKMSREQLDQARAERKKAQDAIRDALKAAVRAGLAG